MSQQSSLKLKKCYEKNSNCIYMEHNHVLKSLLWKQSQTYRPQNGSRLLEEKKCPAHNITSRLSATPNSIDKRGILEPSPSLSCQFLIPPPLLRFWTTAHLKEKKTLFHVIFILLKPKSIHLRQSLSLSYHKPFSLLSSFKISSAT